MATRYNWAALREEYFTSDYLDMMTWHKNSTSLRPKYGTSTFKQHTINWHTQKKEMLMKKAEKTIQKLMEKEAEDTAETLMILIRAIKTRIKDPENLSKKEEKDLKILWEILRVENRLPTKISNDLIGEDPNNKFTSLSDILKAAREAKKQ